jgi:hypothetical protein
MPKMRTLNHKTPMKEEHIHTTADFIFRLFNGLWPIIGVVTLFTLCIAAALMLRALYTACVGRFEPSDYSEIQSEMEDEK